MTFFMCLSAVLYFLGGALQVSMVAIHHEEAPTAADWIVGMLTWWLGAIVLLSAWIVPIDDETFY